MCRSVLSICASHASCLYSCGICEGYCSEYRADRRPMKTTSVLAVTTVVEVYRTTFSFFELAAGVVSPFGDVFVSFVGRARSVRRTSVWRFCLLPSRSANRVPHLAIFVFFSPPPVQTIDLLCVPSLVWCRLGGGGGGVRPKGTVPHARRRRHRGTPCRHQRNGVVNNILGIITVGFVALVCWVGLLRVRYMWRRGGGSDGGSEGPPR